MNECTWKPLSWLLEPQHSVPSSLDWSSPKDKVKEAAQVRVWHLLHPHPSEDTQVSWTPSYSKPSVNAGC